MYVALECGDSFLFIFGIKFLYIFDDFIVYMVGRRDSYR
jgi:hypothetical protein